MVNKKGRAIYPTSYFHVIKPSKSHLRTNEFRLARTLVGFFRSNSHRPLTCTLHSVQVDQLSVEVYHCGAGFKCWNSTFFVYHKHGFSFSRCHTARLCNKSNAIQITKASKYRCFFLHQVIIRITQYILKYKYIPLYNNQASASALIPIGIRRFDGTMQ